MLACEEHRIPGPPPAMYYIADFITEAEEKAILDKTPATRWTSLSHRRLQAIPTQLSANNTLLAAALPDWLSKPAVQRIEALGVFEGAPHGINHCLINEYLPGQGIMPHEDGPAYHPVVATISLGSTLVLDATTKAEPGSEERVKRWRIVQEPRSLLLTMGAAYADTLHGIAEVEDDVDLTANTVANWPLLGTSALIEAAGGSSQRSKRISLTFRDVKRVSNLGKRLLGRGR